MTRSSPLRANRTAPTRFPAPTCSEVEARLKQIDSALAQGVLAPKLAALLEGEKTRLKTVSSGTAVLSEKATGALQSRLREIDHVLQAGIVAPELERKLGAERERIMQLLNRS